MTNGIRKPPEKKVIDKKARRRPAKSKRKGRK